MVYIGVLQNAVDVGYKTMPALKVWAFRTTLVCERCSFMLSTTTQSSSINITAFRSSLRIRWHWCYVWTRSRLIPATGWVANLNEISIRFFRCYDIQLGRTAQKWFVPTNNNFFANLMIKFIAFTHSATKSSSSSWTQTVPTLGNMKLAMQRNWISSGLSNCLYLTWARRLRKHHPFFDFKRYYNWKQK